MLGFPLTCTRTLKVGSNARLINATAFLTEHESSFNPYDLLFYLIALQSSSASNESFVHSRNRKVFYQMLSMPEKRQRDRRIPRVSLVDPHKISSRKLNQSENDRSMTTLTDFDFVAFSWLLNKFASIYNSYAPHTETGVIQKLKRKGRLQLLNAADYLKL